jgi:cytochrome c556
LLTRLPEKNVEDWIKHSEASRDAGESLVKAAKKKDFAAARAAYEKMLTNCNACHKQFEEGKHILEP